MPLGHTDGASASVDQGGGWDAVFADARAVGDTVSDESLADPSGTPQGAASGSSDGTGTGSPDAPQTATTGDDGSTSSAPSDPATPAPAAGDPATPQETDPLAGAEPFTYPVGDETRTIEGAYRLPGDGLYVPEDKVPQFQLMASRAETLERQNRELYERHQSIERLTEWATTDAQGVRTVLRGQPALEAQRVFLVDRMERARTLEAALDDPKVFHTLYEIVTDEAGQYGTPGQQYVVPNAEGIARLKREAAINAREGVLTARANFSKLAAPPPPPEPSIADRAMPTITAFVKEHNITGLTPPDLTALAGLLDRFVHSTPNGRVVDPKFLDVMRDRAALRAEQSKAAAGASRTDAFNGGMGKGRQGAPAPARPITPVPPTFTGRNAPKPREGVSANDMWATLVNEAVSSSV